MNTVTCRQCGTSVSRETLRSGVFVCAECGWRELVPSLAAARVMADENGSTETKSKSKTKAKAKTKTKTKTASVTRERPSSDAAPTPGEDAGFHPLDLEALRALAGPDLARWCAGLLERFGYTVEPAGDGDEQDCDLEATRDGQTIYVDCIAFNERENIGRPECQKLVGAMVGARVVRGMIVTPGSIEDGCRAFAEQVPDLRIDLIDGTRLEETLLEMATGPLGGWWS